MLHSTEDIARHLRAGRLDEARYIAFESPVRPHLSFETQRAIIDGDCLGALCHLQNYGTRSAYTARGACQWAGSYQ